MLISVEGLDGAGKTTLIAGLAPALGATALREPGGALGGDTAVIPSRAWR